MKIVRREDIRGTDRDVQSPAGWTSYRFLLKSDGMGYSLHETILPPGLELQMWYKNHLEAVFCYAGTGSITDISTGEVHQLTPGSLYALDNHDRHIVKSHTELRMVCVFNPPVTGREIHDEDGSYPLPAEDD